VNFIGIFVSIICHKFCYTCPQVHSPGLLAISALPVQPGSVNNGTSQPADFRFPVGLPPNDAWPLSPAHFLSLLYALSSAVDLKIFVSSQPSLFPFVLVFPYSCRHRCLPWTVHWTLGEDVPLSISLENEAGAFGAWLLSCLPVCAYIEVTVCFSQCSCCHRSVLMESCHVLWRPRLYTSTSTIV